MQNLQNELDQIEHKNSEGECSDWAELKSGDKDALRRIYEAHIESLLQYGRRFSYDGQAVEDCIHDLFVSLWKRREGLGKTDSIRRYLLVSLRRSIIKQNQKHSKTNDLKEGREFDLPFTGSVENEIINEEWEIEKRSRLSSAMDQLSARQREAIYLKYHKNLAYEDVAKIMNINYQSVRNLVFDAITKMRHLMSILCLIYAMHSCLS